MSQVSLGKRVLATVLGGLGCGLLLGVILGLVGRAGWIPNSLDGWVQPGVGVAGIVATCFVINWALDRRHPHT